ncbi:DUF885 domain-containing protein [Ideonella livida]|uniref:DUF885 domain-containing protein n=1 Tax=Ideonella livida TaxID=2707176 RepID=A0A7C9PIX9_9BURK|nr:DUF885 domain-containing protein [Ideonella livida]NDY93177.1 DUF885 domain-containing protein [Ideonella livida]
MSMRLQPPPSPARRRLLRAGLAWPAALGVSRAASLSPALAAPSAPPGPVHRLADSLLEGLLSHDPFWASQLGLATPEQAASLPRHLFPDGQAAWRDWVRRSRQALQPWAQAQPDDPAERCLLAVLRHDLDDFEAGLDFPDELLPLHHLGDDPLTQLAQVPGNGLSALDSVAAHQAHLQRLAALPAWCAQARHQLRQGMVQGVVLPRPVVARLAPQLATLGRTDPRHNPFYEAPRRLAELRLSGADRQRLQARYRTVLEREVLPAVRDLAAFLARDYRPRDSAGWGGLSGGAAWYAHAVRSATTRDLSPQAVHELGRQEVARLQAALRALADRWGGWPAGQPLGRFLATYGARPAVRPFRTGQEVVAAYERLDARLQDRLPALFGRRPRAPLAIRLEPALTRDTASDHYSPPAADGSRPGVFFAVVTDPRQYATTGMASLLLHEGSPGHHFQIALAQELPLSRWQRFVGHDAYAEGWAHYAETLGGPLGLYEDPDALLGHLGDALLRAARLVVDTGLHDQGWSHAQACQTLEALAGLSPREARVEVERYMVWPGQALAYATGRRGIEALRERCRERQGAGFSLAAFHDLVLSAGSLPMAVLEQQVLEGAGTAPA